MSLRDERSLMINMAVEKYVITDIETDIVKAVNRYREEHPELKEKHDPMISKEDETNRNREIVIESADRPKCPKCERPMTLWEVNSNPKNQVGGDYKTQWVCNDEVICGYQGEYSKLTIEEQLRRG